MGKYNIQSEQVEELLSLDEISYAISMAQQFEMCKPNQPDLSKIFIKTDTKAPHWFDVLYNDFNIGFMRREAYKPNDHYLVIEWNPIAIEDIHNRIQGIPSVII